MCSQVLEFTKTQTRRTLDDAVEIFLRDRKGTVRGIADDTERTYKERLGMFTTWAAGRGLKHLDEVDADTVDEFFVYLGDEKKKGHGKSNEDNRGRVQKERFSYGSGAPF